MITLPKLIVLVLIVAVIWYWSRGLRTESRPGKEGRPTGAGSDSETLTPCPVCKAYVIEASAKSCGRADCPY